MIIKNDGCAFHILPLATYGAFPENILRAFKHLENYDIETGYSPSSLGISIDETWKHESSYEIEEGRFIAVVGGVRLTTIHPISAWADKLNGALSVLSLSAHGNDETIKQIKQKVGEDNVVQVGVRSMPKEDRSDGMFDVYRIMRAGKGWNGVIKDDIAPLLKDDVYISCDLSVFDPSTIQNVERPVPGGFAWFQIVQLLLAVFSARNVVGFDITGYNRQENDLAPDAYTAAMLLYKMIAYKGKQMEAKTETPPGPDTRTS